MLGYGKNPEDPEFVIENEAAVIQRIFREYERGIGRALRRQWLEPLTFGKTGLTIVLRTGAVYLPVDDSLWKEARTWIK
ncbi:MAG: hypothetical protein IJ088_16435 [Clostridia bacterium]|nr:hypothetical protein [Clostridia bacterium]